MTSAVRIGLSTIQVPDPVQDAAISTWLLYPTTALEAAHRLGPYLLDAAEDGPVQGRDLPLVVVSHGNGGSPWTLRHLAVRLVREGFVVCLLRHPGNTRDDNGLEGSAANLANRPRHLSSVIDAAFACPRIGPCLATGRVGVIGHSIGGYTALAAAGGRPWASAREAADGQAHPVMVTPDARIRALVLLAPATFWFDVAGALADIRIPVLIRSGDRDLITPTHHADLVRRGVPDSALVEVETIAGAGHFSFLSPFPASMTRPDFPPSQDPPGFDREAFQPLLHHDIARFLHRTLHAGGRDALG